MIIATLSTALGTPAIPLDLPPGEAPPPPVVTNVTLDGFAPPVPQRQGNISEDPAPAPPPEPSTVDADTVLERGGTGPNYDLENYRGKYWEAGAPSANIKQVCIFGETTGTSATVVLKPSTSGSAVFSVSISVVTPLAWNCATSDQPWSTASLFVYKQSGTAKIGYESCTSPCTPDSRYSLDSGGSWSTDNWRRGYRVVFQGASDGLFNGGEGGTGYDDHSYRGKYFTQGARGTLTNVCAYVEIAGTSLTIAVKNDPNAAVAFTSTITASSSQTWACTSISVAWNSDSLFIYKQSGTAKVGYDGNSPPDSWYSLDNGANWNSENWRRGFKLAVTTTSSDILENGGQGPPYDGNTFRGKRFDNVRSGTITQICAHVETAGSTLTVAFKTAQDAAPPAFSESIPITVGGGWNCKDVSRSWTSSTLVIYKSSGTASVGYDPNSPTDSVYSQNNGVNWGQDPWRRGYKIIFGGSPNGNPTAVFTPEMHGMRVDVDASASSDPDGDPLTYSWDWGDTTSSTGNPTSHTYSCSATGSFTITLTVTDGRGGSATDTDSVTPLDNIDGDQDGLSQCDEEQQGTSDTSVDTDADGISDYQEWAFWPDRNAVFCNQLRTRCEFPLPNQKDLYVEVDVMSETACLPIAGCFTHADTVPNSVYNHVIVQYASHGIRVVIDVGNALGGGGTVPHQQEADDDDIGALESNPTFFASARRGLFHYSVMAHAGPGCGGAIPAGKRTWLLVARHTVGDCVPESQTVEYRLIGNWIHEIGHNTIGMIEPPVDRYAPPPPQAVDLFHDIYCEYSMSGCDAGGHGYHLNRWTELGGTLSPVMSEKEFESCGGPCVSITLPRGHVVLRADRTILSHIGLLEPPWLLEDAE